MLCFENDANGHHETWCDFLHALHERIDREVDLRSDVCEDCGAEH